MRGRFRRHRSRRLLIHLAHFFSSRRFSIMASATEYERDVDGGASQNGLGELAKLVDEKYRTLAAKAAQGQKVDAEEVIRVCTAVGNSVAAFEKTVAIVRTRMAAKTRIEQATKDKTDGELGRAEYNKL